MTDLMVFNSTWGSKIDGRPIFTMATTEIIRYFPGPQVNNEKCEGNLLCDFSDRDNQTWELVVERQFMECRASKALYAITFQYKNGIQHVEYDVKDHKALNFTKSYSIEGNKTDSGLNATQWYRNRISTMANWVYDANTRAVHDVVVQNLAYTWNITVFLVDWTKPLGTFRLSNGTTVNLSPFRKVQDYLYPKRSRGRCRRCSSNPKFYRPYYTHE